MKSKIVSGPYSRSVEKKPIGLAELSEAIMKAGERSRRERKKQNARRAKLIKDCPCQGCTCLEAQEGGQACGPGVCVRMN